MTTDAGRKDIAFWRTQIEQALTERRAHEPFWEANLRAYAPRATDDPEQYGNAVNNFLGYAYCTKLGRYD